MNRKTRTLSCRSPVRTRPPLLPRSRAPDAAGGSHGADGPTQPAPPPEAHHRGGQHHVRLGAPNSRSLAPLARTRVTALPAFGLTAPARPSGAEIPARMAGDSSASQHLLLKWKGVHETGSTPSLYSTRRKPARQPKAVAAGFEGKCNPGDRAAGPDRLIPPAMQQGKQPFWAWFELLARLTLNPGKHAGNEPGRLAQLDDRNDRAMLVQGDEGSAQVVWLGHRGTPSLDAAAKLPFLAARPIASLGRRGCGELALSAPRLAPLSGKGWSRLHRLGSDLGAAVTGIAQDAGFRSRRSRAMRR